MEDQAPVAAPAAATPTFDLDTLATDGSITLPLEQPNGEHVRGSDGKPVTFDIVSVDDERYRRVYRRVLDEKTQENRGRRPKRMGAAEMERESARLVAATIVGWSDNFSWGGQPFRYSEANAQKLMAEPRLRWIQEWVDSIANDRERFFGKPSTT